MRGEVKSEEKRDGGMEGDEKRRGGEREAARSGVREKCRGGITDEGDREAKD